MCWLELIGKLNAAVVNNVVFWMTNAYCWAGPKVTKQRVLLHRGQDSKSKIQDLQKSKIQNQPASNSMLKNLKNI